MGAHINVRIGAIGLQFGLDLGLGLGQDSDFFICASAYKISSVF